MENKPRLILESSLQSAQAEAKGLGDDYISLEHIFLAYLNGAFPLKGKLSELGLNRLTADGFIKKLRGSQKADSDHPESKFNSLEKYGINLNQLAQSGKLDPVIGRDEEIRRCVQILSRRTKNNPMLIGEPGVGKTAIIEGSSRGGW